MGYPNPNSYGGGSFPGNRLFFVDNDATFPVPVSVPKITFPFEGDSHAPTHSVATLVVATNPTGFKYALGLPDAAQNNTCPEAFILEQRFSIASQWFTPLALDTSYNLTFWDGYQGALNLAALVLVNESTTTEVGNGMVEWVRTYATIPPPRNSYESFGFTFPGITPTIFGKNKNSNFDLISQLANVYNQQGPAAADVLIRIEHKFFLVHGGLNPVSFSPNYVDPASPFYIVPLFQPFTVTFFNKIEYVADVNLLVDQMDYTNLAGATVPAPMKNTIPPATANANNNADSGVPYSQMIGVAEVCVKASVIRPWRGNIYEKVTMFTLAQ